LTKPSAERNPGRESCVFKRRELYGVRGKMKIRKEERGDRNSKGVRAQEKGGSQKEGASGVEKKKKLEQENA